MKRGLVPERTIERSILSIRGERVILDTDLARLYGVTTFRFNEAVKRNRRRFPSDFMFRLTAPEFTALRSQFAMSKLDEGAGGPCLTPSLNTAR